MHAYAVGVAFFVAVWIVLLTTAKQSRRAILGASFGFAHLGPLLQSWYIRDYWRPEYVWKVEMAGIVLAPEDYLFAFAFAGIAAGVFDHLATRRGIAPRSVDLQTTIVQLQLVGAVLLLSMVLLVSVAGLNSVHGTLLACIFGIVLIFTGRKGLIRVALTSATVVALIFWLFYELFFLPLYPLIFVRWWNPAALSGLYLGKVPIEEVAWAWFVALFVGPAVAVCSASWGRSKGIRHVRLGRTERRAAN